MTISDIDNAALIARGRRLEQTTRRRNAFEYLSGTAAAVVLALMSVAAFFDAQSGEDTLVAAGFAALAAGLGIAGAYLFRRRRAAGDRDVAGGGVGSLARRLERERDLLRSAWLWYVAPLVPGFAMVYGGVALAGNPAFALAAGGLTFGFLAFVASINRRAAAQLDGEIATLRDKAGGDRS